MAGSFWFDGSRTLSYNALFNFIIGNRGCGKTYWFKRWAIACFIRDGSQFVYIRRYKQELKKIGKFFDDVAQEFPDHTFEVKGSLFLIDGEVAGTCMALSTSKIEKSTPYPMVDKIIFDEFILDKGAYHYLPDEVTCLLEVYETIARMREGVRMFLLSNAVSSTNPYFLYWKIQPRKGREFTRCRNGELLIHMVADEEFIKAKKKTRFGQLIDGTEYGAYAVENQFLRDDDTFIEKKTGTARYYFTIRFKGELFGIWISWQEGRLWASEDVDPTGRITYSVTMDDHSPNTLLLKNLNRSVMFKTFIEAFQNGCVRFETQKAKNMVYEVIRLAVSR